MLAIGIVVDDAIVVVENVERWLAEGLSPRDAARKAMEEVTGPVIAIALVLCAVFVPTAFMAGISGQFFRQFALTIAASTIISCVQFADSESGPGACYCSNRTNMASTATCSRKRCRERASPSLAACWPICFCLRPSAGSLGIEVGGHGHSAVEAAAHTSATTLLALKAGVFALGAIVGWFASVLVNKLLGAFFRGFNWFFDVTINVYGRMVTGLLRISAIVLMVYVGLMGLTYLGFKTVPVGFIPEQDKGYLVLNAQLPDGASLDRTDKVVREMSEIARKEPGVAHTIDLPGYSAVLGTNISNVGGMFVILDPFEERAGITELGAPAIITRLREKFSKITAARVGVFGAPPVEGLGTTGGFKLQVQDRRSAGMRSLQGAVENLADEGNRDPRLAGLFTSFSVTQPQLYVDVDEEKAKSQQINLQDIDATLQAYLGSFYVNDFFFQNRNWQVNLQAAPRYRMKIDDIGNLEVRNAAGDRVPLRTLINVRYDSGPAIVNHYNLYPSAEINGGTAPGVSSGQAIAIMDNLAATSLPDTMGFEWTELMLQQILASKDLLTKLAFPLAVLFVFLVLAAQYESWSIPLSIHSDCADVPAWRPSLASGSPV